MDATSSLLRRLLADGDIPLSLILELFYAAATFFLAFHRRFKIPDKHHYVVFTAIYFFENQMQVLTFVVRCCDNLKKGVQQPII